MPSTAYQRDSTTYDVAMQIPEGIQRFGERGMRQELVSGSFVPSGTLSPLNANQQTVDVDILVTRIANTFPGQFPKNDNVKALYYYFKSDTTPSKLSAKIFPVLFSAKSPSSEAAGTTVSLDLSNSSWDVANARRLELIDRKADAGLSMSETVQLEWLQRRADSIRARNAAAHVSKLDRLLGHFQSILENIDKPPKSRR